VSWQFEIRTEDFEDWDVWQIIVDLDEFVDIFS